MELEQIISAAVEKQINELFKQTFADKGWENCVNLFRTKVHEEFNRQFKLRKAELHKKIAKAVAECKINGYEITTYIKFNGDQV